EIDRHHRREDHPNPGQDIGDLGAEDLSHRFPTDHLSWAKPGLISPLMSATRSSNGMNADFIALTVNHCRSSHPYPHASTSAADSVDRVVADISRLSVLTVTRKRRRRSSPMGCSAMDGAAP